MASYQIRQRDPLFDSKTQAALERRSKELLGIGLAFVGLLIVMILGSYSADDPSWMSATQEPIQNWLGRIGATIASPLQRILGLGAWAIALVFLVWGGRLITQSGTDRAVCVVFAPIAIFLVCLYSATLIGPQGGALDQGLGGFAGDFFAALFLNLSPFASIGFSLKLLSVVSGIAMVAMLVFVLGFTKSDMRRFGRFLLVGLVMSYALMMSLLGRGASGAASAARNINDARTARRAEVSAQQPMPVPQREARVQRPDAVIEDEAPLAWDVPAEASYVEPQPEPKPGILASLIKRAPDPEPELVEYDALDSEVEMPEEDRVKARISDAIKTRMRQKSALRARRPEPQITRPRGPQPLVLNIEPPVTAPLENAEPVLNDEVASVTATLAEPVVHQQAPMEIDAFTSDIYAHDEPLAEDDVINVFDDTRAYAPADPAPAPIVAPAIPAAPKARAVVENKVRKAVPQSTQAKAEAQPALQFEESHADYERPPLNLLLSPETVERHHLSDEALEENARMLENVLDDYGVKGEIVSVRPGPVVTMYELEPAPGLKASRVIGLADDIARSMSALSARVSTVPGRSVIGIELPNDNREMVVLREILAARDFGDSNMRLPLALGKDIGGDPIVANLAKMPHLLIAGTTGSGKSVAINTMILSLLYKLTPEECRLIMIDPKMLELSVYDGIPHLLSPVVTDPKKAVVALKWVVGEMEDRYRKMSKMGVRNIEGYNGRVQDALSKNEMFSRTVQTGFDDDTGEPVFETEEFAPKKLPYIVVIVDEMADLMMVAGKEIEACIQRLAQMARASGIHLIMATQRPSVDVITGTIKANFPTRISFQVTSKIDSRTILGEQGAEQLLGMGDMLYMAGGAKITRVHGPFCSDEEVEEIVNYLKQFGPPEYIGGVVDGPDDEQAGSIDAVLGLGGNTGGEDALYDQAVGIVLQDRKISTSYIQRKLSIGYNKAAKLVEQMEEQGLISAANHVGKREILVPEQQ
ncbi:DNA translocase FtsK 4TM domain-containing protein [Cochlodiniinecator piscidefendens]|uniref:DNA translocase FtsK 4TM domain-containing protein n=1 Tax=Cochlodiniinecator piscidefendens TaxID=2715756 RepID=UPI001408DA40|nr:DNA translocase FtsK 4TM domain-containing protein [Cochlodiniinecator piscidefendens]